MSAFTIPARGPFSFDAAAAFVDGWPPATEVAEAAAGEVRLCFALDSLDGHAGALVTATERGVRVEPFGAGAEIGPQVARLLSLDHDASDLGEVVAGDPVLSRLYERLGALRPVLFHSPFEAAAWSVISARVQFAQAQRVRQALSAEHGRVLDVGGERMAAFPLPEALLALESFPGLPEEKVRRLHAVAEAALAGRLDPERLREAEPEEALASLQEIRGIGPFYAGLILVRSAGVVDVLPPGIEPRLREATGEAYGLEGPATEADFRRISDRWRPYRTWMAVLMRAATSGPR